MEKIELSDRLLGVANMVTEGNRICDVGCDHGFLSIYLVKQGISPGGIAADVNTGPLKAAQEHIEEFGLGDVLETRLSNGLEKIFQGEADTLAIAGMGGPLILSILENKPEVRDSFSEIIIGPQSKIEEVILGIEEQGLIVTDENYIFEDGKYYPLFHLVPRDKASELQINEAEFNREAVERKLNFLISRNTQVELFSGSLLLESADGALAEDIIGAYGYIFPNRYNATFIKFLEHENNVINAVLAGLEPNKHFERLVELKHKQKVNRLACILCEQSQEEAYYGNCKD